MPKRKTTEQFKTEIYNLVGDEYILLEEYKGCDKEILFRHNSDYCNNNESYISPTQFLLGHRCKICGIAKRNELHTKTHEQFCQEVYQLVGDEYEVISEYINAKINVNLKHNNESCNYYIWNIRPNNFTNKGYRCPKCAGNAKKTPEEYELEINNKFNGEYSILEKYKGSKKHLLTKHNICGHEWLVTPSNLLRSFGCPKCNESKGEKRNR